LALAAVLDGCAHPDNGLSKNDYQDLLNRQAPKAAASEAPPPIPELQPILAAPPPPSTAQRLVTLSVTDPSVPVRDVLLELSRKVGVDVDIDPNIAGGVIISAKDRPFLEVIDRICDLANLRYSFKDNVLKVEVDSMYHETYRMDVLNTVRTAETDMATSTDIGTLIQGGASVAGNKSSSGVASKSTADPWKEIDDNIKQILVNSNPKNQPITSNVSGDAAAPLSAPAGGRSRHSGTPLMGTDSAAYQQAPAEGAPPSAAQAPANAPAADEAPRVAAEPVAAARPAPLANTQQAVYSINRQAGVVSVFGTSRQQKLVKAYLDKVITKEGAQVLIEAKVVEIALNDQFNTGIDWTALRQNLRGTGFGLSNLTPSTNTSSALPTLPKPGDLTQPFGTFGLNAGFTTFGGDLAAMINLVKIYGTTRTLSSPRLTVMNNNTAMLKVAQNHVYFKLTATVTSTPAVAGAAPSQTATYTSQLQTLPIGLVMTVQPSIDAEKGLVTLGLRPTVTAWPGTSVSDPAVALSLASACGNSSSGACSPASIAEAVQSSAVPVVDVREMESVITVPSGAVVVMGGLMQEMVNKNESGVPGALDVPVVGNLFKANTDQTQLTELVVFLKATVVRGAETVDWADKDTYKRFMHDPRPLGF
jgi:type II secretory pathway component GspD/PulD (secretin)